MASGLGRVVSRDTSPISVSAIFRLALRLSPSRKFATLCLIGIGTVELNLPGGSTLVLHNVRHVPELSRPLISVRQLDEVGICAGFSSGVWTLHRGNLLLARGPMVHSLYTLYVTLRGVTYFWWISLCHRYGTDDLETSARPASRTYPEPDTSRNSPSRTISSVSISSMANK